MTRNVAATVLVLLATAGTARLGAMAAPQSDLQLTQALSVMQCLRHTSDLRSLAEPFEVVGTQVARSEVVAASELSFGPDGVLVFPRSSKGQRWSPDCADMLYVVAGRMRNLSDGPATIAWERSRPREAPFGRGQAPAGAAGVAPGEPGLDGSPGSPGNAGFDGDHSPSLVLVVEEIEGPIVLDFRGQDGGVGGTGQTGGNGGAGAPGSAAVPSLFDCKRGPGKGGDGGNGGSGGRGGRGGNGGVGGTVIVITSEEQAAAVKDLLEVDVEGGVPGAGGPPGAGGEAGRGGREGVSRLPCRPAAKAGRDGVAGSAGEPGPEGRTGEAGDFYLIALPRDQFIKVRESALGLGRS